jgi:predicted metal-dependent hydrolase
MDARSENASLGLDRPGIVWLEGRPIPVLRANGSRPFARSSNDVVVVGGPDHLAAAALARWYRREARLSLEASVRRHGARLGLRHGSISVRDPRTRWGSCSSGGGLSFSWRLVVAPPVILDHVVVHELCHTAVPNHSRRFWSMFRSVRPTWREEDRWFEQHGPELQRYRPRLSHLSDSLPAP